MRWALLPWLALAACGEAEARSCSVTQQDGVTEVRCPDGSSWRAPDGAVCEAAGAWLVCGDGSAFPLDPDIPPGCAVEEVGTDGLTVRCEDGSVHELALFGHGEVAGEAFVAGRENHAGVQVEAAGVEGAALTDAQGRYRLRAVPAGRHTLRFSLVGFVPVEVADVPVLPGVRDVDPVLLVPEAP